LKEKKFLRPPKLSFSVGGGGGGGILTGSKGGFLSVSGI